MTFLVSARDEEKGPTQWGPRQALTYIHTLIKMEIKKFWFEKLRNKGRNIYSSCNLCLKSACMNV